MNGWQMHFLQRHKYIGRGADQILPMAPNRVI